MKWEVSILPAAHSDFDIQCGSMQLLADVMARTRVLRWEVTELLLLSKHLLNFRRSKCQSSLARFRRKLQRQRRQNSGCGKHFQISIVS